MKFSIADKSIKQTKDILLILGIFYKDCYQKTLKYISDENKKNIIQVVKNIKIKDNIGSTYFISNTNKVGSNPILLIMLGSKVNINSRIYKKLIINTISSIKNIKYKKSIFFLLNLNFNNSNLYWKIRRSIEYIYESLYEFNNFKSKTKSYKIYMKEIMFYIHDENEIKQANIAISHSVSISKGIIITKNLGNMPSNFCDPHYLSHQSYILKDKYSEKISVEIMDHKKIKNIGMNAYLHVSKGSSKNPYLSIIKYNENKFNGKSPIILIGKGLTFDSGGISIKPSNNMDEMKFDMCGAAAVLGVMHAISELNLNLYVIGILACCENMVDSSSYKPGDIIKTLSGKTVEVINTDAEGRLVLCDVITYVKRFNPRIVIDIATLTGACVIALGHHYTGLISNCDELSENILNASNITEDLAWRLPLNKKFSKQLKSRFADISNISDRSGSAITAGCFLYEFAKEYKWAHLDIAGTAWKSGVYKQATGRPVSLLTQLLINYGDKKI
ncbi:pepA [Wigglesworthia glossinidia endosymbiont of Glossina brevipalpis]|uniref:Probable cytosol aminopeptidase n=1 Tax=Wigglesworthia glossinidia brevipalpis TaxID=36870 RepID=AMPA_WIGBR|nr:RecName: Full=Probable cytosol aminopeptidase; AltName: Full=Leucine aminopeptidase; Short=LAP; AltName: Full=Leucyl aminopeptidase [Wigglesworthia glossinidia endosymbiont of Glossina brevipalpis]BAC24605.1 pepA [Wigglesworthia glossinidia endosymbiont of Glossina brevipalpis]